MLGVSGGMREKGFLKKLVSCPEFGLIYTYQLMVPQGFSLDECPGVPE